MLAPSDLNLPEKFTGWRPGQLETAAKIASSSKFAYLLDAPTGVGKSLIAAAVQRILNKNVAYLATTKQLQDQLLHDFPYAKTIKGRSNYPCLKYPKMYPQISAEVCTHSDEHECEYFSKCPYYVKKRLALSAPLAVLNTAYFLNEANFVGAFSDRELLIVDECLSYRSRILLADGTREYIGKLVNQKKSVNVLSYNEDEGAIESKPVIGWVRNPPPTNTVIVVLDARGFPKIRCTGNHKLLSPRGWVEAGSLAAGDVVYVKSSPRTGCSPPLPAKALDVILGSLLGDAGLTANTSSSGRAFLTFTQKSKEYIDFKIGLLQPLFVADTYMGANWYGEKTISKIGSTSTFSLGALHSLCYPGNVKEVSRKWLASVGDLGLAIFYMDDGGLGNSDSVNFAVQDFSPSSAQLICGWLKKKWGIDAVARDEKGMVIHLVRGGNHRLFSVVAKYIHPSIDYKLPKKWRNKFVEPNIGHWLPLSEATILSTETSPFPRDADPGDSYDLRVADNHNYFANGFLVHNCDTIEDQLMGFIEVVITQRQLSRLKLLPPKYKTKFESWVDWAIGAIRELTPELRSLELDVESKWATISFEDLKRKNQIEKLLAKLRFFVREVDKTWVWYPSADRWVFKPVWVSKYAKNALWKHAKKVLGMSATILNLRQVSLNTGLPSNSVDYLALSSPFPKENRPVYFEPCANVVAKQMDVALPRLADALSAIMTKHPNDRILVHTVSYKVRNYLQKNIKTNRLVTHAQADRASVLEKFKKSNKPLVLLSPSMDRGVDLPDNECRVVVIAKMPYADLGDPQVSKRVHASTDGNTWYAHKTISTIIQMSGRSVRSETDHAVTYILDEQFERLYNEHRYMFPVWFREAVVM